MTDADDDRDDADRSDDNRDDGRLEHRECAVCGERVPEPVYHEHLLKECPGP